MINLGINPYISNDDYHADREFISSSGIKLIRSNPRDFYKRYVLNEDSDSKNSSALDFGNYVHSLVLEPETVVEQYAIFNGEKLEGINDRKNKSVGYVLRFFTYFLKALRTCFAKLGYGDSVK